MDFLSMAGAFWFLPWVPNTIAVLRMMRCWRLGAGADDLYELHHAALSSEDALANLLTLLMTIMMMIHSFSCAWFFAATMHGDDWEKIMKGDPRLPSTDIHSLYL